jgi:hypothetical protein
MLPTTSLAVPPDQCSGDLGLASADGFFQGESAMTMQRRVFMMNVAATGCALGLASMARAAGMPMVAETDAMAVNLNYKADAGQVKHAKYKAGQQCSNCVLYQGKATDAAAACGIFPGKQVAAKGWCTAYAKKA